MEGTVDFVKLCEILRNYRGSRITYECVPVNSFEIDYTSFEIQEPNIEIVNKKIKVYGNNQTRFEINLKDYEHITLNKYKDEEMKNTFIISMKKRENASRTILKIG